MLDRLAASPSKRLLAAAIAALAGIAAHEPLSAAVLNGETRSIAASVAAACAVAGASRRTRTGLFVLCLAAALCGFVRHDAAVAAILPRRGFVPPQETASYAGVIAAYPRATLTGTRLTVALADPPVRAQISADARLEARRGDVVRITCVLRVVEDAPGPDYADYLLVRGITHDCMTRAPVEVVGHARQHVVARAIGALRGWTHRTVERLFPEPDAALLLGLLIGETDTLPPRLKDAFRETGTSHVLAVSGYNITQLSVVSGFLFALAGLRKRRAAAATAVVIAIFTLAAGADASVVRAAIMGSVALLAILYGRAYQGGIALTVAAAAMALVNPFVLFHEVGFQLSFIAVAGLFLFGRRFAALFPWLPEAGGVRGAAGETLSATIATLPLSLYVFGNAAAATFVVNMCILPVIPFAMAGGAITLALGGIVPQLAALPALMTALALRYATAVVNAFAWWIPATPFRLSLAWMLAAYAVLGAGWAWLARRERMKALV